MAELIVAVIGFLANAAVDAGAVEVGLTLTELVDFGSTFAGALLFDAIGLGAAIGLEFLLTPKQKAPTVTGQDIVRQSTAPRQFLVGQDKIGGVPFFDDQDGSNNL